MLIGGKEISAMSSGTTTTKKGGGLGKRCRIPGGEKKGPSSHLKGKGEWRSASDCITGQRKKNLYS